MSRIPWRLILYILLPLGFLISLSGWIVLSQVEEEVEARLQREVEVVGRALRVPIQRAIIENRENQIQEALDSIFMIGSVYGAFVYDENGRLIARVGRGGDDPRYQSYIISVLRDREDTGDYVRFAGDTVYSAFIPVTDVFQNPIGLIQINRDLQEIRTSVGDVRLQILFFYLWFILGIAAIVLTGHYIAQGRGIRRLLNSIGEIQRGNHRHRATLSGPREISIIARAVNRMLDSLDSARDEIRERRAIERILREQALRNDRLVELGQLAGGIAHELGSPLSVIRGQLRRLKRDPDFYSAKSGHAAVCAIEEELGRTEAVVRQLLDFGTRRTPSEQVEVAELFDQAALASKPELSRYKARIRSRISGEPRPFPGNRLQLQLALRNLLSNAARHAPNESIDLEATFHREELVISVRDRGPGIENGCGEPDL